MLTLLFFEQQFSTADDQSQFFEGSCKNIIDNKVICSGEVGHFSLCFGNALGNHFGPILATLGEALEQSVFAGG